jgi:hypothetical protein
MDLPIIKKNYTIKERTHPNQKVCAHCNNYLMGYLEWENGTKFDSWELVHVLTKYCDECKKKVLNKNKKPKPNPQRYCKECNIPIQKGRHRCDPCNKEVIRIKKSLFDKNKRPLYNGFTREQENSFLQQCVSSGIDTTGLIQKEYKRIGKKSRSASWIIGRLKELGLYKKPDMNRSIQIRDRELREQTYKLISDLGFTLHTDNIKRKDIKVKCNECNTILNWYNMYRKGCTKCKAKLKREQKEKTKSEIRDNKNSAKIKEYTSRVETLKEFIHSDRYKEYNSWKETPVIKEYTFYNSISGIECRDKELTYKIQWINYYHYKNSSVCPDKPIKRGYKICNVCVEHKPIKEFNTNSKASSQCKECAKIYRREHLAPIEREKMKEKYKNDPVHRLNHCVRSYVHAAMKGRLKTKRTKEILGIEWNEFRGYVEDRFEAWMSWDNHGIGEGKWALQHIIPRDFAIDEKEIYLLNHYQNFVPMCAIENGILKNRILVEQLNEWHNTDKGIQKIIKRNMDSLISEIEFNKILPTIVREIDTNKIKQSEQKLTKWFSY